MNTILTEDHKRALSPIGFWYFARLIDWQTDADGLVCGGRPITAAELGRPFGDSQDTVLRVLDRLERGGYISRSRTPRGFVIRIHRSKKVFRSRRSTDSDDAQSTLPFAESAQERVRKKSDSPEPERVRSSADSESEDLRTRGGGKGGGRSSVPEVRTAVTLPNTVIRRKNQEESARASAHATSIKPTNRSLVPSGSKADFARVLEEVFAQFWANHCWLKVGKAQAVKAFVGQLRTPDDLQSFLANAPGWAAYYAERRKLQGGSHEFVKHPSTWINSRDWEEPCTLTNKRASRLRSAREELEGL